MPRPRCSPRSARAPPYPAAAMPPSARLVVRAAGRRPRRRVAVAVAAAVLAACGSGGEVEPPAPTAATQAVQQRVEVIRDARAAVARPAAVLAGAAEGARTAVASLREGPPASIETRLAAIEAARSRAVAALDDALARARRIDLRATTPDVQEAGAVWSRALDAADRTASAARADLARLEEAARADAELAALTDAWERPGSFSQQLARLDRTAAAAADFAGQLSRQDDVAACLTTFSRRADAARTTERRTRELRELVAARRGTAFDQRRDAFAAAPLGRDVPLATADAEEFPCWQAQAPVGEAAAEVGAALRALERALNPADLLDGTPSVAGR